ncbi:MAG: sugar transferase [Candidatus Gracilibacteria bacterium]|nr:sugar transferase [Candidatus Gracilibacteria bacterium]
MKKHELIFGIIKIPLEFLMVFCAFFIAKNIRLVSDLIPGVHLPIKTIVDLKLLGFALLGALLYIIVFAIGGLYRLKLYYSKIKEILDIIRLSFYWFILYIAIVYLSREYLYSTDIPRLIILFAFLISIGSIIIERFILNKIQEIFMNKGFLQKRKLLLIVKNDYSEILDDIKDSGIYDIIGYINKKEIKNFPFKYFGGLKDFFELARNRNVDEILIIDSDFIQEELEQIFDYSRTYGIRYRYISNYFDVTKSNTELSFISKIPVVEIKSIGLDSWGRVFKRLVDIFGSIFGIIISFPFMFLVSILIKIEDPDGPVFFKNRRIGRDGKIFNLYKFRYLKWKYCVKDSYGIKPEEDEALKLEKELITKQNARKGPLYKIKNDPRKTKIGTFIEKYSIDELPQLFNVLIGNMSLVGPRPHQPREVEQYKEHQKRVLTIKPGITGMAQINGREKNDFDKEVQLDIFYIENWSILLDLKIFFKTIGTVLKRAMRS